MPTHEVDPISRIEGHLGVKLTTAVNGDGVEVVSACGADVHGNLWRGFENFLIGRDPNDAITFTQRICGVCPVPHGMTSTYAVDAALGYSGNMQTFSDVDADGKGVPAKAVHIRNLVLSAEFLMSSITHFYHLAAPSYIQGPNVPPWTPYFDDSYYHPWLLASASFGTGDLTGGVGVAGKTTLPALAGDGFSADLWSAVIRQYVKALRIRRLTFEASAMFAGRAPMTSCYVAGGVTNDTSNTTAFNMRCDKFAAIVAEVGTFIVQEYVPVVLALGALYPNYDNLGNATTLNTVYPALWTAGNKYAAGPPEAASTGWGAGLGNFLAWGAFPNPVSQNLAVAGGYKLNGASPVVFQTGKSTSAAATTFVTNSLKEHIARSRYQDPLNEFGGDTGNAFPGAVSRTVPKRGVSTKYSWLKAPRLVISSTTYAFEVGPLARLAVNGWYPVDGSTALSSVDLTPLGLVDYMNYTKSNTNSYAHPGSPLAPSTLGINPAMVSADLALALVSAPIPLAVITTDTNVYTSRADCLAHFNDATAVIQGPARDWIVNLKGGLSTIDRLRARAIESLVLVQLMLGAPTPGATGLAPMTWPASGGWVAALKGAAGGTFNYKPTPATGYGFGGTEAPRGALMHFVSIDKGKISKYQCVVPTTWNGSPKDSLGNPGAIEKAMENVPFSAAGGSFTKQAGGTQTTQGGVEALRVAQSFDPCIACAVH